MAVLLMASWHFSAFQHPTRPLKVLRNYGIRALKVRAESDKLARTKMIPPSDVSSVR